MEQYLEICIAVIMTLAVALAIGALILTCIILKDNLKNK
jgi:hypothetical protein